MKIGSVPTPWPSWLIAASPTRASPELLDTFLQTLTRYVVEFGSVDARAGKSVDFIKDKFGYPEEDIKVCSRLKIHLFIAELFLDNDARHG